MGVTVITGASSGIGAAAAMQLTGRGRRVLITGRTPAKLRVVHRQLVAAAPPGLVVPEPVQADLADVDEVRRLARHIMDHHADLDVLANNAAAQPSRREESADGFELGLAVNHLAPFLLTNMLAELIEANAGRVVNTSSSSHAKGSIQFDDLQMTKQWSSSKSYGRSKLANILFTAQLLERTKLPASSFHPGAISTDINRDSPFVRIVKPFERFFLGTPEQGAETLVWLAEDAEGAAPKAVYYADRKPADISPAGRDTRVAARLWDVSADLTGLAG